MNTIDYIKCRSQEFSPTSFTSSRQRCIASCNVHRRNDSDDRNYTSGTRTERYELNVCTRIARTATTSKARNRTKLQNELNCVRFGFVYLCASVAFLSPSLYTIKWSLFRLLAVNFNRNTLQRTIQRNPNCTHLCDSTDVCQDQDIDEWKFIFIRHLYLVKHERVCELRNKKKPPHCSGGVVWRRQRRCPAWTIWVRINNLCY